MPKKGNIFFDSKPINKLNRDSIVDKISIVLQDTEVFNLSLKENITISKNNKFDKKLYKRALEVSQLDKFIKNISNVKKYKSIPVFPSIEIDLAIVVDQDVKNDDIENEIKSSGTGMLKEIRLFDIYRGKQIESGKKSMAYSLSFGEENRTLKDIEVEIIVKRILESLSKKFNARLRE